MTEPPGFHVANVHAVEAGHRQDRLHDALSILLSGFTVGQKASQPVNRCHNATFVFSSVGKRIAWVYFNHSWPGAGNINSEFAILAGAYYARSCHPHPLSGGKEGRSALVTAPVKRYQRIKNTHRFVKFFFVIDKNFFFFAADGQCVGA